jgi:hypothetical protein
MYLCMYYLLLGFLLVHMQSIFINHMVSEENICVGMAQLGVGDATQLDHKI